MQSLRLSSNSDSVRIADARFLMPVCEESATHSVASQAAGDARLERARRSGAHGLREGPRADRARRLVQLMPWRCLLYVLAGAMAVVVFVLGFDGPSMAQAVDLSTPEKTIDAMGTCGGAGSGSAAARRRFPAHQAPWRVGHARDRPRSRDGRGACRVSRRGHHRRKRRGHHWAQDRSSRGGPLCRYPPRCRELRV